jgi:plasmid stabilization system protein ParE
LPGAEHDLNELRSYLVSKFGRSAWLRCFREIKTSLATIRAFPQSGTIPDELAQLGINRFRQVVSGMNIIVYEVSPKVLYVHIICDSRRNLRAYLTRRISI